MLAVTGSCGGDQRQESVEDGPEAKDQIGEVGAGSAASSRTSVKTSVR
jgi:hypothetical protein